ncbi:hypothetical protein H5T89_02680 [bacterium]|nr:hypothetical protein [bacterium]
MRQDLKDTIIKSKIAKELAEYLPSRSPDAWRVWLNRALSKNKLSIEILLNFERLIKICEEAERERIKRKERAKIIKLYAKTFFVSKREAQRRAKLFGLQRLKEELEKKSRK